MSDNGYLLLAGAPEESRIVPIGDKIIVIGRNPDCHVWVSHPLVSRMHCEIWSENGGIFIRDLESNNGTYVNSQRLEKRRRLAFGDLIQIGPLLLQLIQPYEPHGNVFGGNGEGNTSVYSVPVEPSPTLGFSSDVLAIIKFLAEGKSEKEVSATMQMNRHTVHDHVKQVYKRLGITSRAELAAWYWSGVKA